MTTVPLASLAEITGRTRESLRNAQNQGRTPWDDDKFAGVTQRRFSGEEALAVVLAEMLESFGFLAADAAEFVRGHRRIIAMFLDELEAGDVPVARLVVGLRMPVEDSLIGVTWERGFVVGSGTLEEAEDFIAGFMHKIGTEKPRAGAPDRHVRYIGGLHVAVASVNEAYRLLQLRAKRAGFTVAGRTIVKDLG